MTLDAFRQGDLIDSVLQLTVMAADGSGRSVDTPLGVVLVSQTCDVVLANRFMVQLAPCVVLPEKEAREARAGKRPRYAALPSLGDDHFADLEVIATVDKAFLVDRSRRPGVVEDQDVRHFGRSVARKFGRFPFPDEVTPWLRPLEEVVSARAGKLTSPEGAVLDGVVELRIEATGGWRVSPYDLTLVVVLQPGVLPTFPEDSLPELPGDLSAWLYTEAGVLQRRSADIAERLRSSTEPVRRYWLWMALAESWAERCRPKGTPAEGVMAAVNSIVSEVVTADEYPLSRVRRSEQLDLDHLSGPLPE